MIKLERVAHSWGALELFSEATLDLAPGSFHFLTGPSGAGKTTLLRLCYGELRPSRGRVLLFGQDLSTMSRNDLALARRRMGIIHQDCPFLDHLTVAQNVALPLVAAGKSVPEEDLAELLAWVGLANQAHATPPTLSAGERQRAALARAVIMRPEIVLADEPTGNIDWEMALTILSLLVELNRLGVAVLIATHDLHLIRAAKARVSARVLRLSGGKLERAGAEL